MANPETLMGKLGTRTGNALSSLHSGPVSDWKIIFLSSLSLVILVVIASVFIFIKIDKGEIFVFKAVEENTSQTLDMELLRSTVSYYKNKAAEFEKIKNTRPTAVDPSI